MSSLIQHLQQILYFLLVFSGTGLFVGALAVVWKWQWAKRYAVVATTITSIGGLLVALMNISIPLGPTAPDPAKDSIEKFYNFLPLNTDSAFELLHPDRIEEIHRDINPRWSREDFRHSYDTTREYKHLKIEPAPDHVDGKGLFYNVSFDVRDDLPINRLYEMRGAPMKDIFAKGFINEDALLKYITDNLHEFSDFADDKDKDIKRHVEYAKLAALMDPLFVFELQRDLKLQMRDGHPELQADWRHFIQKVGVQKDGETWKVRSGLYPPIGVADYRPGVSP
jgi:hypothetical protein